MIKFKSVVLLGFLGACTFGYADSKIVSAKSFQEIAEIVQNFHAPEKTLLVLDDDDTLTMMSCPKQANIHTCQYLGGPTWYDWQAQLPADSKYRVAKSEMDLIAKSRYLLDINYMVYTDQAIPQVLAKLAQSGVRLMAETARGADYDSATDVQFAHLLADKGTLLSLISDHAPKNSEGLSSLASPYLPCKGNNEGRAVRYEQGIYYVAGQNKGMMLHCLLARLPSQQIENIVFVDDTFKNVQDMADAFKQDKNYQVISVYYTRLAAHKAAFLMGPHAKAYQDEAYKEWHQLQAALGQNLRSPVDEM